MTTDIVIYSKKIPLSRRGKGQTAKRKLFTTVNYWWYDWLMQWKWSAIKGRRGKYYVQRSHHFMSIRMNRLILGLQFGDERKGDHADHDGLNNTIGSEIYPGNLRIATNSDNMANRRPMGSSQYLGVAVHTAPKGSGGLYYYYKASIFKHGKVYRLGSFPYTMQGEIEAARAYDLKAKEIHGEFANLNFKFS